MNAFRMLWLLLTISMVSMGCGGGEEAAWDCVAEPVSFIQVKPFLEQHCTTCHASTRSGDAREGAPIGADFDSYEGIAAEAARGVKLMANGAMPPAGGVTAAERGMFACWVELGSPR